MRGLRDLELSLGLNSDGEPITFSFLVAQHKQEILDVFQSYSECIKLSFNSEFQNMVQVCIFVPFLHEDTPKPVVVPKIAGNRESDHKLMTKINNVLAARNIIIERDMLNVGKEFGDR